MIMKLSGILKSMEEHAERNINQDKNNGVCGTLTEEGMMLKWYVDNIKEIVSDKKEMLTSLLDEYRHRKFCDKNFSDCIDCENHNECNAIRNVLNLIITGNLLKKEEM